MKFIFADSLDFVDPGYNFADDSNSAMRRWHENDEYPHEHLGEAPYDGILVSRALVGGSVRGGKYTAAQAMRFAREGARSFLRYSSETYPNSIVMGDCGAFAYRNAKIPPYSVADTLEFYEDGGFTHGCSVDHLIFEFSDSVRPPSAAVRDRYELTLENARAFVKGAKAVRGLTPIGVIQGWSPSSMAKAAESLTRMGFNYLALGGMVPLKAPQIAQALEAIRSAISARVKLHVLGFGKIDDLDLLRRYKVASFDTTSPLTRAFRDGRRNYYALRSDGSLEYYTAIRIPQATVNARLLQTAKQGRLDQELLVTAERNALEALRLFSKRKLSATAAIDVVLKYDDYAMWNSRLTPKQGIKHVEALRGIYVRTLESRAWELCPCRVCQEVGIEAVIFRSSNRNKRRGIHNLQAFYRSLRIRSEANS